MSATKPTLQPTKSQISIPAAVMVGLVSVAFVLAIVSVISAWVMLVISVGIIDLFWVWMIYQRDRGMRDIDDRFSHPGFSVEVDCRACGKLNRVPGHRLRDRPKCGRCKERLMPRYRVVLCRVSPMPARLSAELDTIWTDEDRLWQSLADHVALETKAKAEAQGQQPHVVN